MFDGVLNGALSEEKVSTTAVTQGNLEIPLAPNPLNLHQTKKQQDEILDCPSSSFPLRRTHQQGRYTKKRVTNSWEVSHKSWIVRCSSRAPGF